MSDASAVPHLLHVFSTFVPAGPEMRTVRLINALGPRYRHSILAIDGRTDARHELDGSAQVDILASLPKAGSLQTLRALRALLRDLAPDLVLSYNWGAFDSVFASCSLGRARKHLHHEDGFNADEADSFKGRRVWTRRLLLPRVGKVVVPSHLLQGIARQHWKLREDRVALFPNGIDLESFGARDGNPELRKQLGIDRETPVIGFVGHLRPVKNTQRLLRSFAALQHAPQPALVMLGEGEERGAIEALSAKLGIEDRVKLVGHQSETPPWYRLMDLFAISSDSEQMPVALLEAMASSLPVVSTDVGDVGHMLADGQADFVVGTDEADTSAALTRAMEALLASADQRSALGTANRRRTEERYSFEGMLDSYRDLYDSILSS